MDFAASIISALLASSSFSMVSFLLLIAVWVQVTNLRFVTMAQTRPKTTKTPRMMYTAIGPCWPDWKFPDLPLVSMRLVVGFEGVSVSVLVVKVLWETISEGDGESVVEMGLKGEVEDKVCIVVSGL